MLRSFRPVFTGIIFVSACIAADAPWSMQNLHEAPATAERT